MLISGTFIDEISHDIPHQNWGRKEWERDFFHMKNMGIDTLMTSPQEKAFHTFLKYNEDLTKIKTNENVEGGSTIEQVQYFINFIT